MRGHEYLPATPDGKRWCKHCGSLFHPHVLQTCVERESVSGLAPVRRTWACEDYDAIKARVAEVKRQRDAALNRSE